jgi:4-amino-4-deoxy-L-arabinose transferase-like glycosyltransferase
VSSLERERWIGPALMVTCVLLYVPFAGNYGLWDPWETHYGEVARQMAERHDAISLYYPCSPIEGRWFWSKPVLSFWLAAPCLWLFGLQWPHARAGELVDSWRAEWALRLPSLTLALVGIWAVFVLVRRIAGARAAACAGLVLATSPSWLSIARQAMTDMPFVVPMTIALVLVGLAILPVHDDATLPRLRLGRGSVPRAPAFFGLCASAIVAGALPLALISAQLHGGFAIGARRFLLPGIVIMLPYWAALAFALVRAARTSSRRALYLMNAWVWCGVATLAKGPAGFGLPALAIALYLVSERRWKSIFTELELPRGLLFFVAVAFPWYHAMLVRHGAPFWRELIGDNYVHRALGRHGDRGSFEYYLQWLGYGTFPWAGVALTGVLRALRATGDTPRARLLRFSICWLLIDYLVLTLVRTKFHHYLLPMLPALAIVAGLFLDELLDNPRPQRLALLLIAAPVTLLCGLDLARLPQRMMWLFNYDYVNVPSVGRAWPAMAIYGDRYEYHAWIVGFAVVAALSVGVLAWMHTRTSTRALPIPVSRALVIAAVALLVGIALGPSTHGPAPTIERWRWLVPLALALPTASWLARLVPASLGARLLALVALAWGGFLVDKMLVELSPHWSQKHVLAAYYARRQPEDPLLVWQLFWRGENFYTANQIYRADDPRERTVFVNGDQPEQRLRAYLDGHPDRRVFLLVERVQQEHLKALLPAAMRASVTQVDDSNNKLVLLEAHTPP